MLLGTTDLKCELANGGYNSSVIAWNPKNVGKDLAHVAIKPGKILEQVTRYCHRFDHWLEMTVRNAAILQERHPGTVVDYLTVADDEAWDDPSNVENLGYAIVTFPRNPKPHEVVEEKKWIKRHWHEPLTYV